VRIGAADVVDALQLFGHRFGPEVIRSHRVDKTERAALLAGAVVGHHDDQGVVAHAGLVEEGDQPRQMLIGVVEHPREGGLQPGEYTLLVRCMRIPRFDAVIARRHLCFGRHDAHCLLTRHALLALDVPAMGERRVVTLDDIGRGLMRCVAGAEGEPRQPRQIRPVRHVIGNEADRLIDQIGGEVIAVGVSARRIDMRVIGDKLGRILIGLGVEEAVEAVEAASERPTVERAGGAAFG